VNSGGTKRRVSSWVSLAFIGLALAVFGWGTGYKVSLYYPPHSTARLMPHAKLLSQHELGAPKNDALASFPIKPASDQGETGLGLVFLFFVFALPVAAFCDSSTVSQREHEASRQLYRHHRASLSYFFLLPPPALI
jgi:hypothetical protein